MNNVNNLKNGNIVKLIESLPLGVSIKIDSENQTLDFYQTSDINNKESLVYLTYEEVYVLKLLLNQFENDELELIFNS